MCHGREDSVSDSVGWKLFFGSSWMYRDTTLAFRQLRTNLRFSVIVVLTLALGIGATTAIFSVVSGVLLHALPFPESERLISLQTVVFPHGEAATKQANDGTLNSGTLDDVSF